MADDLVVDDDLLAAGFIAVPRLIWRNTRLTRDARALYVTLLDFAWEAERPCWPGYERIMGYLCCGRTQVAKYLRELQTHGYLSITRRGQGLTNLYTLHARPVVPKADIQKSRPKSAPPAVPEAATEVDLEELDRAWGNARERLQRQMNATNYATWFAETRLVRWTVGGEAVLSAPDAHVAHELRNRFTAIIRKALQEAAERPVRRVTIQ